MTVENFLARFVDEEKHEEANEALSELFASIHCQMAKDFFKNYKSEPKNKEKVLCQALTVKGQPCKNKAIDGDFCRVHAKKEAPKEEPKEETPKKETRMATIDNETFKRLYMYELTTDKNDRKIIDEEEFLTVHFHSVPEKEIDPRGCFSTCWWSIEDSEIIYKLNYNTSSVFAYELSNFDFMDEDEEEEEEEEKKEEEESEEQLENERRIADKIGKIMEELLEDDKDDEEEVPISDRIAKIIAECEDDEDDEDEDEYGREVTKFTMYGCENIYTKRITVASNAFVYIFYSSDDSVIGVLHNKKYIDTNNVEWCEDDEFIVENEKFTAYGCNTYDTKRITVASNAFVDILYSDEEVFTVSYTENGTSEWIGEDVEFNDDDELKVFGFLL